jgi:hypothetical protein
VTPDHQELAQQAIESAPWAWWVLVVGASIAYSLIEGLKRTWFAPERLEKRAAQDKADREREGLDLAVSLGEDVPESLVATVERAESVARELTGAYLKKMAGVWLVSIAGGTGVGYWLGDPAAGCVGAVLMPILHHIGEWIWDQVKRRIPGGGDDDEPKPRSGNRTARDTSRTFAG